MPGFFFVRKLVCEQFDGSTLALANDNDFGMKTRIFNTDGEMIADADITKCNVTAAGVIITRTAPECDAANTIRIARVRVGCG